MWISVLHPVPQRQVYPKRWEVEVICSGKDILGGIEPNLLGYRQGICLFSGRPKGTTKTRLQGIQSDLFSSLPFVSPVSLGGGIKFTSLKVIRIHCKIKYIPTDQ